MPFGQAFAIGLGFVAGYVDAAGYLRWHAFGANMTGNTVLFAIALFGNPSSALHSLVPIAGFAVGSLLAGALLLYVSPAMLLVLEAALLGAAAFAGDYVSQLSLLSVAMAVQNTSISRFAGVRANTSFITGNYNNLGKALAQILFGHANQTNRRTAAIAATLIVSYALGAFVSAVFAAHASLPLLLVVPIVLALAYEVTRVPIKSEEGEEFDASGRT